MKKMAPVALAIITLMTLLVFILAVIANAFDRPPKDEAPSAEQQVIDARMKILGAIDLSLIEGTGGQSCDILADHSYDSALWFSENADVIEDLNILCWIAQDPASFGDISPGDAVWLGPQVCADLRSGYWLVDVSDFIVEGFSLSRAHADRLVAVALMSYCPDMIDRVR